MKKLLLRTMLLLCALVAGVSGAWAQSDYSNDYTGNVTLSTAGGSNASACKVSISETEYAGIKAGTSKNAGAVKITVPADTKYLHLHLAGWNNETVTLSVTPSDYSSDIALTADSGISGSGTTYTFNGNANTSDYYKVIEFSSALASDTELTFTAKSGKRFVVWGVTAETAGNPSDLSVATAITIDDSGITNTNVYKGTAAGSLAATVKAGETAIDGATVTWESSDQDVATISNTGAVTLVAAGSTTITASYAGVENQYKPSTKTYTLTVTDFDPNTPGTKTTPYTVAQARAAIDAEAGVKGVYATGIVSEIVTAFNSDFGNISYNISDDGETTSAQLQAYRGKGIDGANFTSEDDIQVGDIVVVYGNLKKYNGTYEFDQNNQLVSVYRIPVAQKEDPELIVEDDFSMEITTTKPVEDIYAATSDGEVTVTSGDPSIVKVENGVLTALAKGTAEITVSIAATDTYKSASAKINVTVTVKDAVPPVGPAATGDFVLVKDASALKAGDKILIVGDGVAMAEQKSNNRGAVSVTIENNEIADAGTARIVTLEGSSEGWYFKTSDGYLYAASSSNNYLKSEAKADDNAKATISIDDDGSATIIFQGSYTRNEMRFNPNNGSPLFSCYASDNKTFAKPYIYRAVDATSFDITVGDAEWRTIVTASDVSVPQGLTAYVVTEVADASIKLSPVETLKANNPYILNGAKGTYTLSIALGVEAPAANLLQISTESTGNGVYVLAKPEGNEVGFYKWAGNSLGAGRVYLPAPSAGAPEFLNFVFDGETTGINDVRSKMADVRGDFYDLQGRKVANPTKGLYIVNGKKVIIK